MNKRFVALATFVFISTAPGLQAQSPNGQRPSQTDPPPEVNVLASAVDAISRMHMDAFSDSTLWEAAMDGLIGALNDPYAELFTPQEAAAWEEDTTGNYSGIGLQITLLNEQITVTAVFRGFPADEHGIAVGDVIVGVDEHDAAEWSTQMAADSIRGPVDTSVEVRVMRTGYDEPLTYEINRAQVHVPAVTYGVLDGDIGYVIMDREARNAAMEMNEALADLAGRRGLIIDLRRNPGGFLDESLMLADLFLEPGSTLASTVQRAPGGDPAEPETDSYGDRWPQLVPDLPLVILVDEYTASGAEILAGALQDYDRAVVLGQRTFGKGVVQTVMELPYGRRLRFTTGSWLTPLGRSLQRPRNRQGTPLPEDVDTLPRVETASGRALINGGGVFPDLEIQNDTLPEVVRDFIREATEQEFPLALRVTEFGFTVAGARREAGAPPGVTDEEFAGFVDDLVAEGLDAEPLQDEEVRSWLLWRSKMAVAQRMLDIAAEAAFRTERDPVLREAIRLLGETGSQEALVQAIDSMDGATQGPVGDRRP